VPLLHLGYALVSVLTPEALEHRAAHGPSGRRFEHARAVVEADAVSDAADGGPLVSYDRALGAITLFAH
jgi:hypothetical protein